MSLQVTTGPGSLIALGVGFSDVATFYGLARRAGNWLTAASGDRTLLELIDLDELDIIHRRGLIDVRRFNKSWGRHMTLLVNGKARSFSGKKAEDHLDTFTRFTAVFVCTVAALDAFAPRNIVQRILKAVLLELLKTTDYGEDLVASQLNDRVNSWRSAADVRGLSGHARKNRQRLLQKGVILEGLMPDGDSPLVIDFLQWLMAGETESYTTPSSDAAGIGDCLSRLGIDILTVGGLGEEPDATPCRLEYSSHFIHQASISKKVVQASNVFTRLPCTSISLLHPEESLTKFPLNAHTGNRCRDAWIAGKKAATFVEYVPWVENRDGTMLGTPDDLTYVFYNKGSKPKRTRGKITTLVESLGLVINQELCQGLEKILQRESDATVDWLDEQTMESSYIAEMVSDTKFDDIERINAFTVFQAFFMGYYYHIFLGLVDTSNLQSPVVEGSWGYRNPIFLTDMRILYLSELGTKGTNFVVWRREDVICILSYLLASTPRLIPTLKGNTHNKDNWCVGVVGRRSLLARSLLKPCNTIRDIGQFMLLDIDVSGIPTDINGLVRPGVADTLSEGHLDLDEPAIAISNAFSGSPTEDVSFHIEADWDGDPDEMLLCVRYKGRRITTLNPAAADFYFCLRMFRPALKESHTKTDKAIQHWTVQDCLGRRPLLRHKHPQPFLVQVNEKPRICYAALTWYSEWQMVFMASDCLASSIQAAEEQVAHLKSKQYLLIDGVGRLATVDDWPPAEIEEQIVKLKKQERLKRRNEATLLGDPLIQHQSPELESSTSDSGS